MLAPLVVLWLGATDAPELRGGPLGAWAAARGARVVLGSGPREPAYAARAVEQIEAALENARGAADTAPEELARAERLVLAHPELPQAAWLLAERHALGAHHAGADPDAARAQLARANALEGPRAAAAGAPAAPGAAPAEPGPLPLPPIRPRDELFVDGLPARDEPRWLPGPHHVRLLRHGHLVWAGWLDAGAAPAPPPLDPTLPCSALDLVGVEAGARGPEPAPGVMCSRWAVARPGALGGLDVSPCSGSRCAAWQHVGGGAAAGVAPVEARAWPDWLTWALVGAGAAATAGVVLWQAGAFERAEPGTEFVFTGPSAAAYRF